MSDYLDWFKSTVGHTNMQKQAKREIEYLTEQLAKANERVRELESYKAGKDSMQEASEDVINKFAIERQIQELNWCLSRCNHSFDSWADVGMYDSGISNSEIEARIKQLRKEQEND